MSAASLSPSNLNFAELGPDGAKPFVEYRFPHLQRLAAPAPPGLFQKTALAVAQASAFTYGWDTAFAIRMPDANAAIVKAGSSPKAYAQVAPDKSCSGTGTFGPWQICKGGDGVLLHMAIPLTTGSMSFQGANYPMAGAVVTIELELRLKRILWMASIQAQSAARIRAIPFVRRLLWRR